MSSPTMSHSSLRRRSSFRNRLSLRSDDISKLIDIDDNTNIEENAAINNETTSNKDPCDEEEELDKYIAKLKKEENDWKALRKKLQIQSRELDDKPADVVNVKEGWAFLTKEDKKFLNERLDYATIAQQLDACSKTVAARQRYSDLVINKAMNLLQDCSERTTEVAARLIHCTTHSLCELEQSEETSTEPSVLPQDTCEQFRKLTDQEKARFFDLDIDHTSDSD